MWPASLGGEPSNARYDLIAPSAGRTGTEPTGWGSGNAPASRGERQDSGRDGPARLRALVPRGPAFGGWCLWSSPPGTRQGRGRRSGPRPADPSLSPAARSAWRGRTPAVQAAAPASLRTPNPRTRPPATNTQSPSRARHQAPGVGGV